MWTAEVMQIDDNGADRITAVILYTDGVKRKILETINILGMDEESFKNTIEGRRAQLERSFSFIEKLVPRYDISIPSKVDEIIP